MNARKNCVLVWTALLVIGAPLAARAQDWSSYGGDKASAKYSPLSQIDAASFARLKPSWTWRSPENDIVKANPDLKT